MFSPVGQAGALSADTFRLASAGTRSGRIVHRCEVAFGALGVPQIDPARMLDPCWAAAAHIGCNGTGWCRPEHAARATIGLLRHVRVA